MTKHSRRIFGISSITAAKSGPSVLRWPGDLDKDRKFFGLFSVCARASVHNKEQKTRILSDIYHSFIAKDNGDNEVSYNLKSLAMTDDKNDPDFRNRVITERNSYSYGRQFSRSHDFKTVFIVHRCDKDGVWLPSKSELKAAAALYDNQTQSNA